MVAAKLGTLKVKDAQKLGNIKLVTPDWLWSCAERWEHVDERLYPLSEWSTVTLKPPGKCPACDLTSLTVPEQKLFEFLST